MTTIFIKQVSFLTLLTALFASCAVNKLAKTTTHTYSNVEFAPTPIEKSIGTDFSLSIEPIDAKSLNLEVFESFNRDGGYEKEHASYYTYITKDKNSLSLNERTKLNRL